MIATLPAVLAAAVWLPALTLAPIITVLFSWFGFGVLLSEFSRDVGKRREARLWACWGGSPTLRRLRLRVECDNPHARDRWRSRIAALAPETSLLAADDEVADPIRADRIIEVCVARLRELARDASKFPLVFQENVSYGFRRNLWATHAPRDRRRHGGYRLPSQPRTLPRHRQHRLLRGHAHLVVASDT